MISIRPAFQPAMRPAIRDSFTVPRRRGGGALPAPDPEDPYTADRIDITADQDDLTADLTDGVASGYDTDASTYFAAIVTAGSTISDPNKTAINAFIVGCKADASPNGGVTNWDAMKHIVLLCGADSLTGALVPLKGPSPTPTGFISGDYNKVTGLIGGSGRDLSTGRANNIDPQNNRSRWAYCTSISGASGRWLSAGSSSNMEMITASSGGASINPRFRAGSSTIDTLTAAAGTGLIGTSRILSTDYTAHAWGTEATVTRTSGTPSSGTIHAYSSGLQTNLFTGRMLALGTGEAVTLSSLSARLATLAAALT